MVFALRFASSRVLQTNDPVPELAHHRTKGTTLLRTALADMAAPEEEAAAGAAAVMLVIAVLASAAAADDSEAS